MFEKLDKDYVLHSYARNYVNFKYGINATLYDDKEKDYIDFSSGIGVVSVGHANKEFNQAIKKQIDQIIHISNLYMIEPQVKLAKELVTKSGFDMRCFFANSGAEANEAAIKIARKYGEVQGKIKRYKIITLKHSFHGRSISTLKATAQESMHNYFGPFPDGFVYAKDIDQIKELCDDHTIGVMLELIQGEGGVEPQDKKKIQELEQFLKQKDILLMIDEVQTGIYRTGELLACHLYEISPQIITLAKGIANGVPIGVVMSSLKDIFSPGDHGSTFGGNYLSTRAALKVLEILDRYKNSGEFDENMIYFEDRLKNFAKKYPNIILKEVGFGFMRGLRIKSSDMLAKIIDESFKSGVLLLKAGRDTLRFLPPLTISKMEIDEGFKRLDMVFSKTV